MPIQGENPNAKPMPTNRQDTDPASNAPPSITRPSTEPKNPFNDAAQKVLNDATTSPTKPAGLPGAAPEMPFYDRGDT
jgi:hypothetical protein